MEYDVVSGYGFYSCEVEQKYREKQSFSIGELITLCNKYPSKYFRFIGTPATVGDIHSWRGSYDIPAISHNTGKRNGAEIAKRLVSQLNLEHHGWKGGTYCYNLDDIFYLAHQGTSSDHQVVGYEVTENDVVLITKIVPY